MIGFKNFLLKGNLIELAVAFIMAASFTVVVNEFTALLTNVVGKVFDQPDFQNADIGGVNVGLFINAVIAFVLTAAVLYFLVVTPYTKAKERFFPAEASGPTEIELLIQIRDSLATKDA